MQSQYRSHPVTGPVRCFTVTHARRNLNQLIADTNQDGVPLHITSPNGNAVIVSEDDWNALQETLYLMSVPGLAQRIRESMSAPKEEFLTEEEVEW